MTLLYKLHCLLIVGYIYIMEYQVPRKRIIKRKRIAGKKDYTSLHVSKQLKKSGLVDLIDPIVENIRNNQWIMTTMVENRKNICDLVIQKFWSKLGSTLLKEFNYDFVTI